MKYKFIIKPPLTKDLEREILNFGKKEKVEFEFTEKGRSSLKSAKNLTKNAILNGFERIIVVGGDGLVNEVVNGIFEVKEKTPEDFAIGIIPRGTGNNFAKSLLIPKNVKKAFEIIKSDKKISVDVGKVNDIYFINCFSLGFDAKVNYLANEIKEKYQFLPKSFSYFLAALKEIFSQIPNYEIEIQGKEINLKSNLSLIAITNSQAYGSIFKINPQALISDGKFNICLISPPGKIEAIKILFLTIQGKHIGHKKVKNHLFSYPIRISLKEKVIWEIDGEVFPPENKFEIQVLPKALKFISQ